MHKILNYKIGLAILLLAILNNYLIAQAPAKFKYQAVVRNSSGSIVANQAVSFRLSIVQGSVSGTSVYTETQTLGTNDFGVANLTIGDGQAVSGDLNTVAWSAGPHFLKIELDINGGSNYLLMGVSELLSVPYALYAEKTAQSEADHDTSATNELQTLSLSGNTISISNGNSVTYQYQAIALSGDTLYLSNGGFVVLSDYMDNTDNQTLTITGNQLQISGGNSITITGAVDLDADPTNEIQQLQLSGDTLKISDGNAVLLTDADTTNELQLLSLSGDTLFLSNGNYVVLPPDFDSDTTNEIQSLSVSGDRLMLSKSNYVIMDIDSTNELQNISIVGDTIKLSNGGFVKLPQPTNAIGPVGSCIESISPTPPIGYSASGEISIGKVVFDKLPQIDRENGFQIPLIHNDSLYFLGRLISGSSAYPECKSTSVLTGQSSVLPDKLYDGNALRSVYFNDRIYEFGQQTTGSLTSKNSEYFDLNTRTWHATAPLPDFINIGGYNQPWVVASDSMIYIITANEEIYQFNPNTETYSSLGLTTDCGGNDPSNNPIYMGNKLFILKHNSATYQYYPCILDLANNSWHEGERLYLGNSADEPHGWFKYKDLAVSYCTRNTANNQRYYLRFYDMINDIWLDETVDVPESGLTDFQSSNGTDMFLLDWSGNDYHLASPIKQYYKYCVD